MAFCEDASLTYLNRLGYNVIRLPRTGLLPLEVLGCEIGRPPEPIGPLPSSFSWLPGDGIQGRLRALRVLLDQKSHQVRTRSSERLA